MEGERERVCVCVRQREEGGREGEGEKYIGGRRRPITMDIWGGAIVNGKVYAQRFSRINY